MRKTEEPSVQGAPTKRDAGKIGLTYVSALGDILLVIIGLNILVFLVIAHLTGATEAVVVIAGAGTLLTGIYRTTREIILLA